MHHTAKVITFCPEPSLASFVFFSTAVSIQKQQSFLWYPSSQVSRNPVTLCASASGLSWRSSSNWNFPERLNNRLFKSNNPVFAFWGNWLKGFLLVLLPWKRSAIIIISSSTLAEATPKETHLTKRGLKMWFSSEQELWVHECGNRRASNHLGEIITSLLQDCNMITSTCFLKGSMQKKSRPGEVNSRALSGYSILVYLFQSVIFICSSLRVLLLTDVLLSTGPVKEQS